MLSEFIAKVGRGIPTTPVSRQRRGDAVGTPRPTTSVYRATK